MCWEEFLSRLGQDAAGGGSVSHTRNQLEAAVRAKRSTEAIELIPEVCNGHIIICDRACNNQLSEHKKLLIFGVLAVS